MGDMIKMGKSDKIDSRQYLEIIHSIEEQVGKSIAHFTYLNRFAHRMDMPLSKVNVNDCMEELIVLLHRFANQKRISFEKEFQKDPPPINSNPSMIQFLVFNFLEELLTTLDKDSRIIIKTENLERLRHNQDYSKRKYIRYRLREKRSVLRKLSIMCLQCWEGPFQSRKMVERP